MPCPTIPAPPQCPTLPRRPIRHYRRGRLRKLTHKQSLFDQLTSHIKGFVGGRGVGKTEVGAHFILKHAQPGDPWLVVSPDYNVIEDTTWPTFERVAKQTGQWVRGIKSPTPRAWFRPMGGGPLCQVVFRSAEKPDKLRGGSWAGIWFDEASIMVHEAFLFSIPALRWRGRSGTILVTMTPKGRSHWTFGLFFEETDEGERELLDDDPELLEDVSRYQEIAGKWYRQCAGTGLIQAHSRENPFLPPTYEHDIGAHLSSKLREQELAGQFIELDGLYFRREWFGFVNEVPRSAARVRYWDRACLLGNTQVVTSEGPKPIMDVRAGDRVLTRQGWKPVLWSGPTKSVSETVCAIFSDGRTLEGTGDHLVWTENRGWVELQGLDAKDIVRTAEWRTTETTNSNPSCSMDCDLRDTKGSGTTTVITGIQTSENTATSPCIERCGSTTTDPYPMAIIFTTRTKTGTITRSKILSASPGVSTVCGTGISGPRQNIANYCRGLENCRLPRPGGTAKRGRRRLTYGEPRPGRGRRSSMVLAKSVERSSRPSACERRGFAVATAETSIAASSQINGKGDWLTSCVRNAGKRFEGGNAPGAVPQRAGPSGGGRTETTLVYDLTVADAHEFYANGILVHNSTAGGGCYSAGVLMARADSGIFYVEDVRRGQWGYEERNQQILKAAYEDDQEYGGTVQIWGEQEGGSAGKEVSQQFVKMLAGYPVHVDIVTGKGTRLIHGMELPHKPKLIRAQGMIAQAEAGNIKLKRAKWNDDYLSELACFGESSIMDMADASFGGLNKLTRMWTTDPGWTGRIEQVVDGERFGVHLDKGQNRTRKR